jgi:glycerol-3-phosphate acyltransferase PlsY
MNGALAMVAAYLLGSIPFAWIVARMGGVDIHSVGSRNPGASNVYRSVGPAAGVLVLLLDIGKGIAAVWIARRWGGSGEWIPVLGGMVAIAGHTWTVFLRFRGGKGVATAAGVLFSLVPAATAFCFALFLVSVAASRMISLGSIIAAAALPFVIVVDARIGGEALSVPVFIFALLVALLVIGRHRSNIGRIAAGTESRFSFRRREG